MIMSKEIIIKYEKIIDFHLTSKTKNKLNLSPNTKEYNKDNIELFSIEKKDEINSNFKIQKKINSKQFDKSKLVNEIKKNKNFIYNIYDNSNFIKNDNNNNNLYYKPKNSDYNYKDTISQSDSPIVEQENNNNDCFLTNDNYLKIIDNNISISLNKYYLFYNLLIGKGSFKSVYFRLYKNKNIPVVIKKRNEINEIYRKSFVFSKSTRLF